MSSEDTKEMIVEYMGKGFVDNIVDMLKHDHELFTVLPELISSENGRVRIGAIVLAETMIDDYGDELRAVAVDVAKGLKHHEPTIRGDVTHLLSIIGDAGVVGELETALDRETVIPIAEAIRETIEELSCD